MKSKTFSFNKTIFHKNATLYWPLWGIYTVILQLILPLSLWGGFHNASRTFQGGPTVDEARFEVLANVLELQIPMLLVFVMAAVFAMVFFSYLFNGRNSNMIHALPVTRADLYGTNLITGLVFLIIPQVIAFMLSVLVCLAYGVSHVQYLGIWILAMAGFSIACYGMAVLCVMLTGQMLAVAAYYVIGNFLYVGVRTIVSLIISIFAFGIDYSDVVQAIHLEFLSPFYYAFRLVDFHKRTEWVNNVYTAVTGIRFSGAHIVAGYTIMGVMFLVLSYFLYKKRQLESAGDFLTFPVLKPIFRWGVGFCGSFSLACLTAGILATMNIGEELPIFIAGIMIYGILFFYVAEMLVCKSFKVFRKKRWGECAVYTVFLLASFGCMMLTAGKFESFCPDQDDVQTAFVYLDYPIEYGTEDVKQVLDLQKQILSNSRELQKLDRESNEQAVIDILYRTSKGNWISREYTVPLKSEQFDYAAQIQKKELEKDPFMKQLVCYDYEDIQIKGGTMERYDQDMNYQGDREISQKQAQSIYDALCKDAEEGSLQKYNMPYCEEDGEDDETPYSYQLYLEYQLPEGATYENIYERCQGNSGYSTSVMETVREGIYSSRTVYDGDEDSGGYGPVPYSYKRDGTWTIPVSIGKECTNTMRALIENGVISSEEQ